MAAWHGRYTVRVVSSPAGHAGTYGDCGTPFDGRCLMSVDVSDWTEEERAAWTEAFPADPVFPSLPDMFGDDYGRCR